MRLPAPDQHLTYCTNIHPGETWPEVMTNLERHTLAVRRAIAPDQPFGVGLRLSAIAAEALATPGTFAAFEDFLRGNDLYVFTINGFPYGPFHRQRVKEEVYQPDWLHEERVQYTDRLADLLVRLLPEGQDGSISTVPGTFKPLGEVPEAPAQIAHNLLRHVGHLVRLREQTGRTVALALEPEPMCFLETTLEVVSFFQGHLFARAGIEQLRQATGLGAGAAEEALRRHLGVCYDVCHAAVEFEDARASLAQLRAAGIGIPKLQLSAALRIARVDEGALRHLRRFDEGVYLHQVVERRDGHLRRYLDLGDAFRAGAGEAAEWRVHFHVPVFLAELEHFGTTQDFLRAILAEHRGQAISAHLEVETYTWDVLPEEYRRVDVATAVARELAWVLDQLHA